MQEPNYVRQRTLMRIALNGTLVRRVSFFWLRLPTCKRTLRRANEPMRLLEQTPTGFGSCRGLASPGCGGGHCTGAISTAEPSSGSSSPQTIIKFSALPENTDQSYIFDGPPGRPGFLRAALSNEATPAAHPVQWSVWHLALLEGLPPAVSRVVSAFHEPRQKSLNRVGDSSV